MKTQNRFNKFLITSLILHAGILLAILLIPKLVPENERIEVVLLEDALLQSEDSVAEVEDNLAKQIVETDEKTANDTLNEKAKYLSAKNNSVEKESIAKIGREFKNEPTKPRLATQAQKKESHKPSLFGDKFNAYDALEKRMAKNDGTGQEQREAQKGKNGNVGAEATSTDKLEGVQQTLKTALNTKEYKYYGYYQRIKTQLNQWWQPEVKQRVSRLMTQGRTVAAASDGKTRNRVTKLIIVLNDVGTLVTVQVIGESGIRDLDETAIEAFRQAAPFPNPPRGMIENDGHIRIRWDFVVES